MVIVLIFVCDECVMFVELLFNYLYYIRCCFVRFLDQTKSSWNCKRTQHHKWKFSKILLNLYIIERKIFICGADFWDLRWEIFEFLFIYFFFRYFRINRPSQHMLWAHKNIFHGNEVWWGFWWNSLKINGFEKFLRGIHCMKCAILDDEKKISKVKKNDFFSGCCFQNFEWYVWSTISPNIIIVRTLWD